MEASITQDSEGGATTPLAPGSTLAGHYRLVRVVGAGGMGTVWEALNTWTDRRVAIKLMAEDPAFPHGGGHATPPVHRVERFLREARATARIRHPNVVDVLDMGQDADRGVLYIVYEYLDGESLRSALSHGAVAPPDAAAHLVPVMDALVAAHREEVVHRDLKPENIVLARDPSGTLVPTVIDFGIAKVATADALSITRSGAALGTAAYMSPEQARGASDIDPRTDIWSLGVIWFESLTGRLPYEGEGYNEVLARILTSDPPLLASVAPTVPTRLSAAIDRALTRDRDARHPTMAAFLADVRAALEDQDPAPGPPREGVGEGAPRLDPSQPAAGAVAAVPRAVTGGAMVTDPVPAPVVARRRPAPVWLVAAVVVTALAAGTVGALHHAASAPVSPPPPAHGVRPAVVRAVQPAVPAPVSLAVQSPLGASVDPPPRVPVEATRTGTAPRATTVHHRVTPVMAPTTYPTPSHPVNGAPVLEP